MTGYPFPWKFERERYTDHYLMGHVTEAQVQKGILGVLATYKVDAVAIDAGGKRQRGRMMGAAAKAGVDLSKISNVKTWYSIPAGFSDLEATLAPSGVALYIEVKAPAWIDGKGKIVRRAGVASPDQLAFLMSKHRRGAVVFVAWSWSDVPRSLDVLLEANLKAVMG